MKWRIEELNAEVTRKKYEEEVDRQLTNNREINNIEIEWNKIKRGLIDSAGKTLGGSDRERRKEWIDDECKNAIKEKTNARLKWIRARQE
ncbi:hypothetical protein ILUMI_23265 [Ignelater luminosus]|uniref:Uncharacterized protein n=1 Tax=Ignelater luminosus TaxID=2038154 RepID=A0A8K0CCU0_IGNLU|nr:hypothetical protein ILUMI_23265 [Ignelater luminosus]